MTLHQRYTHSTLTRRMDWQPFIETYTDFPVTVTRFIGKKAKQKGEEKAKREKQKRAEREKRRSTSVENGQSKKKVI